MSVKSHQKLYRNHSYGVLATVILRMQSRNENFHNAFVLFIDSVKSYVNTDSYTLVQQ